ncbi:DMT family transporter [Prosthecomicrobium sp. N25]
MAVATLAAKPLQDEERDPRKGVLLMALGVALFSMLNATVKWQSEIFPINQIIFFRNTFALVPVFLMARAMGGMRALASRRPGEQVFLSLVWTGVLFLIFSAYHIMPLADATAILFMQPIAVTLLSAPLAGDRVGWREWTAVLIGIGGVLLMVNPTGQGSTLGAGLAFAGMILSSFSMIMQRRLSKSEPSIAIVTYTLGVSAVLMVPTLPYSWVAPTGPQLAGLVAMGLASGAFQYLTVRALYHANASTVSTVSYTKMFWAIVIGFLVFGDVPTVPVVVGTLVIMASTALAYRSGKSARAAATR